MAKTKTIRVTIEKREKSGLYVATSNDLPELLVMDESIEKVITDTPSVVALIQKAKQDGKKSKNQRAKRPSCGFVGGDFDLVSC